MFKKLKDKIAEEVKSSPQRIQQLTQSVTEKIQNATSDESFFSIADDDAPSSSPNPEPGFSNVSLSSYSTPNSGHYRRNSNSSVASDMSFLPRYESATNLYHLQSDLDVSASEVEDNASTSSQLGHLSKEQIYAAFQKSQMRYHKYRGRYTDIANHYKELERENAKMKSVLVETQDKALRRVAELREQCSLEQKAKAHLENALRVELDERQYVIDTLKTKVGLLQNTKPADVTPNDDGDSTQNDANLEILTKDLKDARVEIENLNAKIQEYKANAIVFGSKEGDFKKKIFELDEALKQRTAENAEVLERERENNLIIAQTKMELHTEIQNRDLEIANLKLDVEALKSDLDSYENEPKSSGAKMENLQSQNGKLIEKVEDLTQKCNNYENELLKTEQLRIEIRNLNKAVETAKTKALELEEAETKLRSQLRELEETKVENLQLCEQLKSKQAECDAKIAAYREDTKKQLLTLESKIEEKITNKYAEKERKLTSDFQDKLQHLSKSDNNVKETQLKLLEKEEEARDLDEKLRNLEVILQQQTGKYKDLEANHLELITESAGVRNQLVTLEKKNSELDDSLTRQQNETCALRNESTSLQQNCASLQNELANLREHNETSELQSDNANLREELIGLQAKIPSYEAAQTKLQNEISDLTRHNSELRESLDATQSEIDERKTQARDGEAKIAALQQELAQNQTELAIAKETLDSTKQSLNKKIKEQKTKFHSEVESLKTEVLSFKEKNEAVQNCIDDYKRTLNEYETGASEKSTRLNDLMVENDALKAKIEQKTDDMQVIQKNLEQLEDEKVNLAAQLQQTVTDSDGLKEKILLLRTDCLRHEQSYETLKVESATQLSSNKSLQDQKLQLDSDIAELQARLQERDTQNHALQDELSRVRDEAQSDNERTKENNIRVLDEISELQRRNNELSLDYRQISQENEGLLVELAESKLKCETLAGERTQWEDREQNYETEKKTILDELDESKTEIERLKLETTKTKDEQDAEKLEAENKSLKVQLSKLEERCETCDKQKKQLETQLCELENQYTEISHERQLLRDEVQELKISPINMTNHAEKLDNLDIINVERALAPNMKKLQEDHEKEMIHLNEKLVQYKSLDLTNRSSIQFYENELQKMKNKNEKLNRKLDETLVTLNHCTELSTSTETEYLRNVLYNYMLGKEGMVLARVIAAVCKFDEPQTDAILQREQQKQTLLGQLGFLP